MGVAGLHAGCPTQDQVANRADLCGYSEFVLLGPVVS
jgi:hypothetical protein